MGTRVGEGKWGNWRDFVEAFILLQIAIFLEIFKNLPTVSDSDKIAIGCIFSTKPSVGQQGKFLLWIHIRPTGGPPLKQILRHYSCSYRFFDKRCSDLTDHWLNRIIG